jgi:hypothetical protein
MQGASQRRRLVLAGVAALSVLSAACSSAGRDGAAEDNRQAAADPPASVEDRKAILEREGKKNVPQRAPDTSPPETEGSGEVPPQIVAIFQDDLARRALVKHADISVVSATEQQWPDGAMGCAQPGAMYTQMIVPGYRVVLEAAGNRYAYHSDRRGNFIVCSNGMPLPPVKQQDKDPAPAY